MPREYLIQPTRFAATIPPRPAFGNAYAPVVWVSPAHTLMYSRPGTPAGSDRSVDFTVNGFLQLVFNTPLPSGGAGELNITASVISSYNGTSNPVGQKSDVFFTGLKPSDSIYGVSPRTINFRQSHFVGNLGQIVYYLVTFGATAGGVPPTPIDVTFRGALVSSDPI
jgi:hypothetical protein